MLPSNNPVVHLTFLTSVGAGGLGPPSPGATPTFAARPLGGGALRQVGDSENRLLPRSLGEFVSDDFRRDRSDRKKKKKELRGAEMLLLLAKLIHLHGTLSPWQFHDKSGETPAEAGGGRRAGPRLSAQDAVNHFGFGGLVSSEMN